MRAPPSFVGKALLHCVCTYRPMVIIDGARGPPPSRTIQSFNGDLSCPPSQSIISAGTTSLFSRPRCTGQSSIIDAPIIWFTGRTNVTPCRTEMIFQSNSLLLAVSHTYRARHCSTTIYTSEKYIYIYLGRGVSGEINGTQLAVCVWRYSHGSDAIN